jgi:diadenosine tetraphosphate (Ap4A) HIT family hydrolase
VRHLFADLSAGESAHFGPLAQRVSAALTAALHPTRVYVALGLRAKAQAEGDLAPLGEVTALADRLRKALS